MKMKKKCNFDEKVNISVLTPRIEKPHQAAQGSLSGKALGYGRTARIAEEWGILFTPFIPTWFWNQVSFM